MPRGDSLLRTGRARVWQEDASFCSRRGVHAHFWLLLGGLLSHMRAGVAPAAAAVGRLDARVAVYGGLGDTRRTACSAEGLDNQVQGGEGGVVAGELRTQGLEQLADGGALHGSRGLDR